MHRIRLGFLPLLIHSPHFPSHWWFLNWRRACVDMGYSTAHKKVASFFFSFLFFLEKTNPIDSSSTVNNKTFTSTPNTTKQEEKKTKRKRIDNSGHGMRQQCRPEIKTPRDEPGLFKGDSNSCRLRKRSLKNVAQEKRQQTQDGGDVEGDLLGRHGTLWGGGKGQWGCRLACHCL